MIMGDATQLQQIVINLCTNAWQALSGSTGHIMMDIGTVRIDERAGGDAAGSLPPGDYAHLSVTDNGQGMDAATRDRVFEPFFSTKASGHGTGLGLSVVHGIVASHRGLITVRGRPGGGTIFDLFFPVTDAPAEDVIVTSTLAAAEQGRGQRVMYVDDDDVMLVMVAHLLERLGYRATCLVDPGVAIATVQAQPGVYDIVVTDYNMPSMSGLDVAMALRRVDADLPVVITSGFISDELRRAAAELNVFEVMRKENTLEELGALLARVLRGAQSGSRSAPACLPGPSSAG
jgi:CheY-like chemotaxis protein